MIPLEEVAAAKLRVRAWLDGWDGDRRMVNETVVCGSFGGGPRLDLADLRAVLEAAEGPHEAAIITYGPPDEDGMLPVRVHKTFLREEDAWLALSDLDIVGARVAFWDDNGRDSGWRAVR